MGNETSQAIGFDDKLQSFFYVLLMVCLHRMISCSPSMYYLLLLFVELDMALVHLCYMCVMSYLNLEYDELGISCFHRV